MAALSPPTTRVGTPIPIPRVESVFTAIRVEGGLFPAEFLQAVVGERVPGRAPTDYGMLPTRNLRDEIGRYWRDAEMLWQEYRRDRERADRDAQRAGVERWLLRLLRDVLGYADIGKAPPGTYVGERGFPITHRAWDGSVPLLLTVAGRDLDRASPEFGDGGRRRAVHAAMQEYLNAEPSALWGIASNGVRLRLLRDNPSLTRPAYIEADLERIFEEGLYPDFAALWLVAHASRVAPGKGGMAGCWLERWRAVGAETGQRALTQLRAGVTKALRDLGAGFVEHPSNEALRAAFHDGTLTAENLHQQLLRLVYRLILLATAEERGVLHTPDATAEARALYAQGYALARLRERSRRRRHYDGHADLWPGLTVTFRALARGAPPLGLPALGGLFEEDQCPALDGAALSNRRLLEAVHALAFFTDRGALQRVNYRDMDTEELGSVYESLLELYPVVQVATRPWTFAFAGDDGQGTDAQATQRRLSGSYYTPPPLVLELGRCALDPLIERTIRDNPTNPREALLRLRVIDPAAGSGHFLLMAARRLADAVARLDADGDLPDEAVRRHALREVIRRCIYGVDRNPLSVELCKTALWIEALEPGKPLSFLDAHIRCGDALVGVTDLRVLAEGVPNAAFDAFVGDDEAAARTFRRQNKAQRESPQPSLALGLTVPADLADGLDALSEESEDDVAATRAKRRRLEELRSGPLGYRLKTACDLWCAAFFAMKQLGEIRGRELCPTTDSVWRSLQGTTIYPPMVAEADRLAQLYRFFHWPLEFPDVARDGGFDLVLGNPPWETTSPDTKEFFAAYDPQVRFMSKEEQTVAFERLKGHPGIAARWDAYRRELYLQTNFYKESGRYRMFAPGNLGKGDLNVYRMFVETALAQVRPGGCAAQFVPEGLYKGANSAAIRAVLLSDFELRVLLGLVNLRGVWFPAVHPQFEFCLYVAWKGGPTTTFSAGFRVASLDQLSSSTDGKVLQLPASLVREFSPDALAVMEFAAQTDIDICRKMYAHYPKFGEQVPGQPQRVYMAEVHMGGDRELFPEGAEGLPLFEGRMIDLYDYRAKAYASGRGRAAIWSDLPFGSSAKAVVPQWRVPSELVPEKTRDRVQRYRIGFCDVVNPTTEKCLVSAIIPPDSLCGHSVPTLLLVGGEMADMLLWVAIANSLVMDFLVRKKVRLHMTYTVVDSLPFPRGWVSIPAAESIISRCYSLTACGDEMEAFRAAVPGSPGVPTIADCIDDPEERARLMAEIEVLVARDIYGLSRTDLLYVLDPGNVLGPNSEIETFRVLRERELRTYGEYRTQRLVLEAWDRLGAGTLPAQFDLPSQHASPSPMQGQKRPVSAQLPDGSWSRTAPNDGDTSAALAAILKAISRPTATRSIRLAATLMLEPRLLMPLLPQPRAREWQRLVGQEANLLPGGVVGLVQRINPSWGRAVIQFQGNGWLRENGEARTWQAGLGLDALQTDGWPAGRAGFVLGALSTINLDGAITSMPDDVRGWITDAEAA